MELFLSVILSTWRLEYLDSQGFNQVETHYQESACRERARYLANQGFRLTNNCQLLYKVR